MTTERWMEIWRNMTPEARDYDRYVGQIPPGASMACETEGGRLAMAQRQEQREQDHERGCSCHINPPCGFCVDQGDEIDMEDFGDTVFIGSRKNHAERALVAGIQFFLATDWPGSPAWAEGRTQ